jgi:ribosome maturation factor RimP
MPVPPPDKVTELVGGVVADSGAELETVTVSAAGRRSVVKLVVDAEDGLDLDAVAELTRAVSAVLDEEPSIGEAAYTLEVTTPGVDRPLTHERHWRRNRGRRAAVRVGGELLTVRIGEVVDATVVLVLPDRREPTVRTVALADVEHAVVEVEFSNPDPRELALSGAPRATPTSAPDGNDTADDGNDTADDEENR